MAVTKTLHKLRNTRDLRSEIADMAARLSANRSRGRLAVVDPVVTALTVQQEWDRVLSALAPDVRARMALSIESGQGDPGTMPSSVPSTRCQLDRANYRFEVVRLLLGATLEGKGPHPESGIAAHLEGTQVGLVETLGASPTPVRSALVALRNAGLIKGLRSLEIEPDALSTELLSRLGALPQTLRFRFERGAQIRSPVELVDRAGALLGPSGPARWKPFALSGTPVARQDVPGLDLIGTPRLDLVLHVPRGATEFDADVMRSLDDGLEPETNVLAPTPVVVTLVRAGTRFDRAAGPNQVRHAHPCDAFLSLLDMELREQALQYAAAVRR